MGLLDDAIREHLELKRQHGADPGEVAREERAALMPLRAEEDPESSASSLDLSEPPLGLDVAAPSGEGPPADAEDSPLSDSSNPLQETAEIDMRTVLEGMDSDEEYSWSEVDREAGAASTTAVPADSERRSTATPEVEEDSQEWEAPAKRTGRLGRLMGRGRGSDGE